MTFRNKRSISARWGLLKQIQFPSFLFFGSVSDLSTKAFATYLVLLMLHSRKMRGIKPVERQLEFVAVVKASRATLSRYTGYSPRSLDKAIAELTAKRLVEVERVQKAREEKGHLAGAKPNRYYLRYPKPAANRLLNLEENYEVFEVKGGVNVLYDNRVSYFTAPEALVTEHEKPWALANLSSSEIRLYLGLLWLANRKRSNVFEIETSELRRLSQIKDKRTFEKVKDHLQTLGLLRIDELETFTQNSPHLQITLCDPTTGEPVIDPSTDARNNPANYYLEGPKGSKRFILNDDTEEDRENLLMEFLGPDAPTIKQGDGGVKIQCPFHDDNTPSCSVSIKLRCFYCFGCKKKGNWLALLTQINGGDEGATIEKIASGRGEIGTFRDPDRNAEAIYSYIDADGKLIKQVLRYQDEDGGKKFLQRQLGRQGWVWNARGVGPALYNLDRLTDINPSNNPSVVCITEGEKDANTITDQGLRSNDRRPVIGVTSGGADSWDDGLADYLVGKRVIVMADDDAPGEKYKQAVIASLEKRNIPYRVVSFAEDGCKDVSEFMKIHSSGELAERIGEDWMETEELFLVGVGEDIQI